MIKGPAILKDPEEWVSRMSEPEPNSNCWIWLGSRNPKGYGKTFFGKNTIAHRAIYELFVRPVPTGYELDHLCRNKGCVNPAHLEVVTGVENMRRRRKNACQMGHTFTPDNTITRIVRGIEKRWCRTCVRVYMREYGRKRPRRRVS